jgi:cytochrome c
MKSLYPVAIAAMGVLVCVPAWAQGDAGRGERLFRACAPCHSLETNRNMTGPSLAELWNRKAGGLASFSRYSPALRQSGIVWDDKSLDEWIKDPQHFVPGNTMTFPGIKDARQRADVLAFLKDATQPGHAPAAPTRRGDQMGGMMGMMGGGQVPNLKKLDADERVQGIAHCRDTYRVTTADGKTRDFWERNLRFKTDVSDDGPHKGAPALVPAGMMGDRADVIFAAPDEISGLIAERC